MNIDEIKEESIRESIPSVSASTGNFLEMLAVLSGAKNIVEVGCANGYATGYLIGAAIKNGGRVIAFEKDAPRRKMAENNLACHIKRGTLALIEADALKAVELIPQDIDFLFIDAMKRQYRAILETFLPYLRKGAIVFSDDIYFQGVLEPEKTLDRHKTIVKGLREYLAYLNELERSGAVKNYFYNYEDGIAVTIINK
jgi:predicted O-methyltransferase YrrM